MPATTTHRTLQYIIIIYTMHPGSITVLACQSLTQLVETFIKNFPLVCQSQCIYLSKSLDGFVKVGLVKGVTNICYKYLLKEKQRENSIIQKPKPDKIDKLSTLGFLQTETSPYDFLLLPPPPLKLNKKDYGGTSKTLHIHPRFHEVKQQKPF